jgi:predicted peptidase
MVKTFFGFLLMFIGTDIPCVSQTVIEGFIAKLYRDSNRQQMPYRLFTPKAYDKSQEYPLIIWLHGAGGAGTDNTRQISGD